MRDQQHDEATSPNYLTTPRSRTKSRQCHLDQFALLHHFLDPSSPASELILWLTPEQIEDVARYVYEATRRD